MAFSPSRNAVLAIAVCLVGCSQDAQAPDSAKAPPSALPAVASEPPILGRTDLLQAVAEVSDAFVAGGDYPQAAAAIADRRFALKLPFGCLGPSAEADIGYAYDDRRQTIKLVARPQQWLNQAWAADMLASPETEAIEGFWLRRPWLKGESCPMGPTGAGAAAASPEVLGLAQVFDDASSRLRIRANRPYEVTRRFDPDSPPSPQGFRLALEGRVVAPEGSRPVLCMTESADRRPVCLVRVEFDRVAFETPEGALLAEWRS